MESCEIPSDEPLVVKEVDGQQIVVVQILHGKARLHIGPVGCQGYDDTW